MGKNEGRAGHFGQRGKNNSSAYDKLSLLLRPSGRIRLPARRTGLEMLVHVGEMTLFEMELNHLGSLPSKETEKRSEDKVLV